MPILFDDGAIRVVQRSHPAGAGEPRGTLVTFAELTFRPDGEKIWGGKPAQQLGYDAIGIVSYGRDWFPRASMERAAGIIRERLLPRAVAYGYSMGGYGALKYGRMLGLTRALAICPQYSINPRDVPGDHRFIKSFDPSLHENMAIRRGDVTDVALQLADPYYIDDRINSEAISALGGVEWVKTPFLNHASIWLLAETAFLDRILDAVIDGDAKRVRGLIRDRRGMTPHWFRNVGRTAMLRGRDELALKLWDRALAMGQNESIRHDDLVDTVPWSLRGHFLRGRPEKAMAALIRLDPLLERKARALEVVGEALLYGSEWVAAEHKFRAILAIDHTSFRAWVAVMTALDRQGKLTEAVGLARTGCSVNPGVVELEILAEWLQSCLQVAEGRMKDALATLARLDPRADRNPRALKAIEDVVLASDRRPVAEESSQADIALPSVWLALAYKLDVQARVVDAVEVAEAGCDARPGDVGIKILTGWLTLRLHLDRGRIKEAVATLAHLDSLLKGNAKAVESVSKYMLVSPNDEAILDRFRVALAEGSDGARVWLTLARAFESQGRLADAAEVARAGSDAHPADLELAVLAGWTLLRVGPIASAAPFFRRALRDRPQGQGALPALREARLRVGLSKALLGGGQHAAGFAEARRAVRLAPRDSVIWLWLARCLAQTAGRSVVRRRPAPRTRDAGLS